MGDVGGRGQTEEGREQLRDAGGKRRIFAGGIWGGPSPSFCASAFRDCPGTLCPRCLRARVDSAGSTASSECHYRLSAKPVASLTLEGGSGGPPSSAPSTAVPAEVRGCARAVPPPPRSHAQAAHGALGRPHHAATSERDSAALLDAPV